MRFVKIDKMMDLSRKLVAMDFDQKREETSQGLLWSVLMILHYIGYFFICLPFVIPTFYKEWQDVIGKVVYHGRFFSSIGVYSYMILAMLFVIITWKKSVYLKGICFIIVANLQMWVLDVGIPSYSIEQTILSPLKEQCYDLLIILPFVSMWYDVFLWGISSLFHFEFKFLNTKLETIVLVTILIGSIVLPYILPRIMFR